ncbi:MAG: twin-arginine translocase TatA/TatE family subunit [Verrucomicrobiota bacterium]|nr:twin-arginine translocase TatA/TatE family subunit [Verrucomicrobiota bacterium]
MNFIFLGFGFPQGGEWMYILIVVILVFGSKKIPELARGLGKAMREFNKARSEIDNEFRNIAVEKESNDLEEPVRQLSQPAQIVPHSESSAIPEGTRTESGEIQSPYSHFTLKLDHQKPGDTIYDPHTGGPFKVPAADSTKSTSTPADLS